MIEKYTEFAIDRSAEGAKKWMEGNDAGYPRSWAQEAKDTTRRGYVAYEHDFEAPPIAGYERLEKDGLVVRGETVIRSGQERVCFRLANPAKETT